MKDISHLTDEEILELLSLPVPASLAERRRQADKSASWLLAHNLRAQERGAEKGVCDSEN